MLYVIQSETWIFVPGHWNPVIFATWLNLRLPMICGKNYYGEPLGTLCNTLLLWLSPCIHVQSLTIMSTHSVQNTLLLICCHSVLVPTHSLTICMYMSVCKRCIILLSFLVKTGRYSSLQVNDTCAVLQFALFCGWRKSWQGISSWVASWWNLWITTQHLNVFVCLLFTSICRVSYCTVDPYYDKVFCYISRNPETKQLECHAFLCSKKSKVESSGSRLHAVNTVCDNRLKQLPWL